MRSAVADTLHYLAGKPGRRLGCAFGERPRCRAQMIASSERDRCCPRCGCAQYLGEANPNGLGDGQGYSTFVRKPPHNIIQYMSYKMHGCWVRLGMEILLRTSNRLFAESFGKLIKTRPSAQADEIRRSEAFRQLLVSGLSHSGIVLRKPTEKKRNKRLHVRRRSAE